MYLVRIGVVGIASLVLFSFGSDGSAVTNGERISQPAANPPPAESTAPVQDPTPLPTFGDPDIGPAVGELRGTLVDRDGCILLVHNSSEFLVLWTPGSKFDPATRSITIGTTGRAVTLNTALTMAGGEIDPPAVSASYPRNAPDFQPC